MEICNIKKCTGCGMCSNICSTNAISLIRMHNDFYYPTIDEKKCINCKLCIQKCPVNIEKRNITNIKKVIAGWNKDRYVRKISSSGGIFSLLAKEIIKNNGVVIGASWDENFKLEHCVIDKIEDIKKLRGSKYVQSNTGDIYKKIKIILETGKKVLFSGTPCQNHALKQFLNKEYENLYQIDLVCHGVPSQEMLKRHLREINPQNKKIEEINFRYKDPYWDYSYVYVKFSDGDFYQKLTIDDAYFNLFNIGYSLRDSCNQCNYTSIYRYSDITLADFWDYSPKSFKMRDYQKGISLILLNSIKGEEIFKMIKQNLNYKEDSLINAKNGNKALREPFIVPEEKKKLFWKAYCEGMSINELELRFTGHPFRLPKLLGLRRLKNRLKWVKYFGK